MFFPSEWCFVFFYLVTTAWIFYISLYVIIQSIKKRIYSVSDYSDIGTHYLYVL